MTRRRQLVLLLLVALMAIVVVLGFSSWRWTGQLQVLASNPKQTAVYTCGAPFGSSSVHAPSGLTAHPVDKPCGQRGGYRIMTVVDLALGVGGVILLLAWRRDPNVDLAA